MSATQPSKKYDHEFFRDQFAHQRSLGGTIKRVTEYAKSQSASEVFVKVACNALKKTSCCALAGCGAGGILGGITAGPSGALAMGVKGAKWGAIVGLIFSACSEAEYVLEEYQAWRVEHQRDKVWNKLNELGREEGLLEFECPIKLDWIVNPVVTNCGHKFEYQALVDRLEDVQRCPSCNFERGLTYSAAPHVTVAFKEAVGDLIAREGRDNQIPEDVREGFIALSRDLANITERNYRKACKELQRLRTSREISLLAYDRHLTILDSIFYPEEQANGQ